MKYPHDPQLAVFADAVRGVLGLAPLYVATPRRNEEERFGETQPYRYVDMNGGRRLPKKVPA